MIITLIFISLWKDQSCIGLEIAYKDGNWIVVNSDQSYEGYRSGIRVGDIIVSIDHGAVGDYSNIKKWNHAEGAAAIEFRKPGQSDSRVVNIPKSDAVKNVLAKLPLYILGFTFWIVGFITWHRRPFLIQACAFFWLNLFIGLAINLSPASSCGIPYAPEAETIAFASIPVLLLNFFSVIPVENKSVFYRHAKKIFLLFYMGIVILIMLQSFEIIRISSIIRRLTLANVTIGILFVLFYLILKAFDRNRKIRNQAVILLGGAILGFCPAILLITIPTVFSGPFLQNFEAGSLFVAFIPVTWYYVIINEYLPDSRRLFGEILSFFIAAVIASVLLTIVLIYLHIIETLSMSIFLLVVSVTLIVMFCFILMSETSKRLLEKYNIYEGDRTLNKKVLQLTDSLALLADNDLFEQMIKNLKIQGIFFIAENKSTGCMKRAAGIFTDDVAVQQQFAEYFEASKYVFEGTDEGHEAILLEDGPAAVFIPFCYDFFLCGIFLGHHESFIKYEKNELVFITLIAKQMAQRVLTIHTITNLSQEIKELDRKAKQEMLRDRLQWMPKFFFNNFEKERKLLAEEIHAGPLQLGLDASRWLKVLSDDSNVAADEKATQVIAHLQKITEQLNYELRQTCNTLRPPTLSQLGLLSAVETLCESTMSKEPLVISLKWDGIDHDARYHEDVEIVAYRFMQEGLTNAVKYANVDKIQLSIVCSDQRLVMTVTDTGKGFNTKHIDDWVLKGGHLGLVGMKERVESIGGSLDIYSELGQGTTLIAAIPIENSDEAAAKL
ncbi:ATP-binding protein [Dehalobacter sp. DCM]|uniref:ATP-binding protein n=1 Tax=Dehalobacter sp. DCM TaxID=2907827 RepID=UPI003081A409|nr:ATP-binding protein [Dehalobacter sp. DCM]